MSNINYVKKDKVYKIGRMSVKKYIMYLLLPAVVLLGLGIGLIVNSISLDNSKIAASYSETGNVDYKVYLKNNNYYSEKYLGKDMQYIANLINMINIKFNYEMSATKELDYNYTYDVKAILKITDKDNKEKVLYTKEDLLKENEGIKITGDKFDVLEEVDIDYDKYNTYANSFRSDYALIADAELIVKMDIKVNGKSTELKNELDTNNNLQITIPLTEQTVNIGMDASSIKNNEYLDYEKEFRINNNPLFIGGSVSSVVGIVCLIILIYLYLTKYSNDPYQNALQKILKKYDTYIVSAKNSFVEKDDIIRVENFTELLDAQKMEQTPIVFFEVEPDNKAYFIVNGAKTTYRFTLTRAYQVKRLQDKTNNEI